ncbi:MAG: PEP-CTERM sorting domain-containing protein [Candidatus Korobacteraceae bacterium]
MKLRIASLSLLAVCLILAAIPAMAQEIVYENGPPNGQVDAWTINFGFAVSDTFEVCCHEGHGGPATQTTINEISFAAWVEPGDTASSVELAIGSTGFFSNNLFDETVSLTQSSCSTNNFGFNVCTETGDFNGPALNNGNDFLTLENATTVEGNPLYWDENSGVGCMSMGCPSAAQENTLGTIPSEAFTLNGFVSSSTTGTTPEPSTILLFGSGLLGLTGMLRHKIKR